MKQPTQGQKWPGLGKNVPHFLVMLAVGVILAASCSAGPVFSRQHKGGEELHASVEKGPNSLSGGWGYAKFPGKSAPAPYVPLPVQWVPCDAGVARPAPRFELSCATIRVPLDYDDPTGPTLDIGVSNTHIRGATPRNGPLLVNPGGPGSPGISSGPRLASQIPARVVDDFAVIGFDPRGTGRSGQVHCVPAETLTQLAQLSDRQQPEGAASAEHVMSVMNERCLRENGARILHLSTEAAARDMESIRHALGAPYISFLGYSYGTFLGAVYAHLYPQSVRAMVLDSPVDFTHSSADFFQGVIESSEEVFDDFAQWASRGPHAVELTELRSRIEKLLAHNPAALDMRDVFDKLRHYSQWTQLVEVLARGLRGESPLITAPANSLAASSLHAIWCDDQTLEHRIGAEEAAWFAREWSHKAPIFGYGFAQQSLPGILDCAGWPSSAHPASPELTSGTGAAPILVVGGMHDPNTPYSWAVEFVETLGNAALVSAERPGHAQYLGSRTGGGCVDNAVEEYLAHLTQPQPGVVCDLDD